MDLENSTGLEAQSGESAGAVAPQQVIETPTDAAEQESVVDSQTTSHNDDFAMVEADSGAADDAGSEEPAADPDGAGQDGEGQKQKAQRQSQEENAAIRAARLRAQRDAEAAAAARMDAEIANSGAVNPYTGRPFSGLAEFREYGQRVQSAELEQRAKETGRSVEELREEQANNAFISGLRRQAERQSEQQAQKQARAQAERDFMAADIRDFMSRHPEVTVEQMEALENNQQFMQFCGSRYKREPLANLYDDYLALVGNAGTAAIQKAASKAAKSTGGGTAGGATLTPSQKAALDKWNSEYPEMKMTAKEFLGR